MKVVEERVVRIPIDEIRALVRDHYGLDLAGIEPYLDQDSLAFSVRLVEGTFEGDRETNAGLSRLSQSSTAHPEGKGAGTRIEPVPVVRVEPLTPRKKRVRRRRRNRVKTRGWRILAKIKNSNGLVANVYEPLVEALAGRQVARSEQRRIVRQLMVANRNNPSPESVDYFLENTLEYLRKREVEKAQVP